MGALDGGEIEEILSVIWIRFSKLDLAATTAEYAGVPANPDSLDWVLSHWAHFTVRRFIFVYVLFCVHCMHV